MSAPTFSGKEAKAFQASSLLSASNEVFPENNFPIWYRTHGFSIAIDTNMGKSWIIDNTFCQFLTQEENGSGIKVVDSKVSFSNKDSSSLSVIANSLYEYGYLELNAKNLAAYVCLMIIGEVEENYFKGLVQILAEEEKVIELIKNLKPASTKAVSQTDGWSSALDNFYKNRLYNIH